MVTITLKGVRYEITKTSSNSSKKLKATFINQRTGRENTILFGQKGYQHYYDKTKLLALSLNHMDKNRRANYRKRHSGDILNRPSAGLLSYYILW